jgi:flagellar biosynthesis protein FlhG
LAEPIHDQAEGLRRLLEQNFLSVLTITSGGTDTGKTTTVISLAAALARSGKHVLVIDENAGANNVSATLGISAHRDLLDVIRRDKTLDEVIILGAGGFFILPAGRGMRVLGKLSTDDRAHVINCFAQLAQPIDVILIDAAPGRSSQMLTLALSAHEIVVVVSPEPASITAAYALIKHTCGHHQDKQHFHVMVNKAGTETQAKMIFDNMADVARRHLSVSLDFMGFVPQDGKLCLGRRVTGAIPATASAAAFSRIAESLADWPCPDDEERGLERFMECLLLSSRNSSADAATAVGAR